MPKASILIIVISVGMVGACGISYAGIAEFNAAVRRGDYVAAASEAESVWESFDKSSPQAATIAREFGFINYLAGNFQKAEYFAALLTGHGSVLVENDDQPEVSAILLQLSQFSQDKTEDNRKALAQALKGRLALDGVDSISLIAAETLYKHDWGKAKWEQAGDSARVAEELYSRSGPTYLSSLREAQFVTVVTAFLQKPNVADLYGIIELQNRLADDMNAGIDQEATRRRIEELNWKTLAWAYTADRYFFYNHTYQSLSLELKGSSINNVTSGCRRDVSLGDLSYPKKWSENEVVGVVVISLNFEKDGSLISHKILSDAPPRMFSDPVAENAPTFRFENRNDPEDESCSQSDFNSVQAITFLPGCVELYQEGKCEAREIRPQIIRGNEVEQRIIWEPEGW